MNLLARELAKKLADREADEIRRRVAVLEGKGR